jgi:hypothetical protein
MSANYYYLLEVKVGAIELSDANLARAQSCGWSTTSKGLKSGYSGFVWSLVKTCQTVSGDLENKTELDSLDVCGRE